MKKKIFCVTAIFVLLISLVSCPPVAEDTPGVKDITTPVVVSGTAGEALKAPVSITIELEKGKFNAIETLDVKSWFKETVDGLEYKLDKAVETNATSLTIVISGTPSKESTTSLSFITIPKANFAYAVEDVRVNFPVNSKYNIEKQKEEPSTPTDPTDPDTPEPDVPTPDTPSKTEPIAKEISDSVIVSGVVGKSITPVSIFVELKQGAFKAITNLDVSPWFEDTVNGLSYSLKKTVEENDTSLTIVISGTPTVQSIAAIGNITIPKENFDYATKDLIVELYDSDKYNIQNAKTVSGDMKLITVDGEIPEAVDYKNNIATIELGDNTGDLYLVISNPTTGSLLSPSISGFTETTETYFSSTSSRSVSKDFNYFGNADANVGIIDKVYEYMPEIKLEDATQSRTKAVKAANDFVSPYKDKNVGDSVNLYVEGTAGAVPSTIRLKRTVNTAFGDKTLIIAVQDSMWNTPLKDPSVANTAIIDQAFINDQADAFLKDGLNNDIYDYVTAIYGEEWGWNDSMYYRYISDTDEILIFFAQIEEQTSATSAVAGYFYSGNNLNNSESSNEAICLTIDAYYNAYNPESSLTTMAHEFQHAVHFYQRVAKKGIKKYQVNLPSGGIRDVDYHASVKSDTWVNEMFAALAEDAVAKFIGVSGPGYNDVALGGPKYDYPSLEIAVNGRIPQYFTAQRYTLTDWDGTSEIGSLYPYGLVYSFGSYLVRNYGVDFIKNYMASDMIEYPVTMEWRNDDVHAIVGESKAYEIVVDAVRKASGNSAITWEDLIRGWGASILLSDDITAVKPYKLSRFDINGDYFWWTEPYKEYGLSIPSLDYFCYTTSRGQMWENGDVLSTVGPYIFNQYTDRPYSKKDSSFRANTNTFLKLDENVSGTKTYTIVGDSSLKYTFVLVSDLTEDF